MIRRFLSLTGGVALVVAAAATGAYAADDKDKVRAMEGAKTSLTQAIEMAEKEGKGKAIDVEFDTSDKGGEYDVKVLTQDRLTNYKIDAATGAVLSADNEPIEKFFTRLKPEEVSAAQATLAQAIGVAEKSVGGRATEAEVEREADRVQYDVTVAKADGSTHSVKVDGASGQIAEAK